MVDVATHVAEIRHFHVFCGSGLGALGFQRAHVRVGKVVAKMRCIGGIDIDPGAIRDFSKFVGVDGTVLDLFTREQFEDFHAECVGKRKRCRGCNNTGRPPAGWREATAEDIRNAAGGERPHIVFGSAPCKGYSSLQNARRAGSRRYRALNALVARVHELMLEAWGDDPPELFILENVPRIATRGRETLDDLRHVLEMAGYVVNETTHDCGELGGLAQHRQRFLLVARHRAKVPGFLYEPPKKRVRGVGEVLGELPLPGDPLGGPMHRVPKVKWLTWVRLALIEAGSDWRSLHRLDVEDGFVRGLGIVPLKRNFGGGPLGVTPWDDPAGTVAGQSRPTNGNFSVADPRPPLRWARHNGGYGSYGVTCWDDPAHAVSGKAHAAVGWFNVADPRAATRWGGKGKYEVAGWCDPARTVIGASTTGNGAAAVADPRIERYGDHSGKMRVERWDRPAHTVTGSDRVGSGAMSIADPRLGADVDDVEGRRFNNVYRIVAWDQPSQAVTGGSGPSAGGQSIADPRVGSKRLDGPYLTAKHYGVLRWDQPSDAVTGSACHDNGAHSVADFRLPLADDRLDPAPVIIALDGTWHRPFTTLELAALQGFPVLAADREAVCFDGDVDSVWREHIGNGVPVPAAEAIGTEMARTLLLAWSGQRFAFRRTPVWVHPLAIALSVEAA
jgi:site-specific DNA-cytosine methylase